MGTIAGSWASISSGMFRLSGICVQVKHILLMGCPFSQFHKICIPQSPLIPIGPDDLPDILAPTLTFVSVLRTDVLIAGPFEATLKPLLRKLHIAEPLLDRIIVPCFHRQLPAILSRFPNAVVIRSVEQCADALSSIRTVSVKADLHYNYHIKLSLACQLTSVIRLITTGEACAAPALTELLETVRPDDLWLYREVAAVSASQSGQGQMQHLACILREDVEHRAKANNETLIVASAFIERPLDNYRTYADILFSLETEEEKFHWVRRYISPFPHLIGPGFLEARLTRLMNRYIAVLFSLTLPLLVQYGIGIEAHSQNMVARVCLETREIKGFVARDFSGARIHLPTLMKRRSNLPSALDIKHACLEDIREIWERTHHALLQNHVGYLLCALGLDKRGGWRVVREELEKVLNPLHCPLGRELHEYFLKETMSLKCFLSLNLDGTGRWVSFINRPLL